MKKAALVSIYREHIDNILSGKKIFEYRKALPRHEISQLAFYCSAPTQKIVAIAEVLRLLAEPPTRIWDKTAIGAGISRRIFREYYAGCSTAIVFILGDIYEMETPLALSALSACPVPPQSFRYLDDADMKLISERKSVDPTVRNSLLFMGGVHGVGKSTLAEEMPKLMGYQHFNAGDLISARRKKMTKAEKRVQDIKGNQDVLLEEIRRIQTRHRRLLITGHFTLLNQEGKIEPVDVAVFRTMKPDRLILLQGNAEMIRDNLQNRDHKKYDLSFIRKWQAEEKAQARCVSDTLGVHLDMIASDDLDTLKKLIYESRTP